jgi:putative glutamine amidotransferase
MPVIAVARCNKLPDYEASIRRAGGDVRVVDYNVDVPADVIASVNGLVLTGGGDVLPSLYGAEAHPRFDGGEPGRDECEIELVRRAMAADLPVLAICRGLQVLNVACGGTLVQDIPDEVGMTVTHRVPSPRDSIAHTVAVESGSLLERLMAERFRAGQPWPVNSRHHQAVKVRGEGLVASATAPDGVIEAIEDPRQRFVLGVQWHPENFWRTGDFLALFEGFVRASALTR